MASAMSVPTTVTVVPVTALMIIVPSSVIHVTTLVIVAATSITIVIALMIVVSAPTIVVSTLMVIVTVTITRITMFPSPVIILRMLRVLPIFLITSVSYSFLVATACIGMIPGVIAIMT